MNFEEKIIERLKRVEREVERLRVKERPAGGSGVTDHGALTGLSDDDHPQYLLTTAKAADSDKLDGVLGTGYVKTTGTQVIGGIKTFSILPTLPTAIPTTNQAVRKGYADSTYLGKTAKAADSDKLDGLDSTDFALASGLGAWQSWTPTVTGWAAGYTCTARYCKVGKLVSVKIMIVGTSDSTAVYITLPFASVADGVFAWAYALDNGAAQATPAYVVLDTSMQVRVYKTATGAPWTGSGGKRVLTTFTYEAA